MFNVPRRVAAETWRRERRPSKERGGFGEAASLFARTRALLGWTLYWATGGAGWAGAAG